MTSVLVVDPTGRSGELIQDSDRQRMTAMAAELEAYRMAVDGVRMFCGLRAEHERGGVARKSAQHVLDLLADLP